VLYLPLEIVVNTRMRHKIAALFIIIFVLAVCAVRHTAAAPQKRQGKRPAAAPASAAPSAKLPASAERWVRTTLRKMTLEEKVGQVMWDRADGRFLNEQAPAFLKLKERIRKLHLGGYVIFAGTPHDTAAFANALQRASKLPLLMAADFERGPAMRVALSSAVPDNMAIGATGDPAYAAWAAELTAREARAMGVQWIYAPVADVNNNPDNPIINTRSYGEDPAQVAKFVAAYVRAAEAAGVLSTAKHFPGHGDTATDSHIALGVVTGDRARLERVELPPFRAAIEAGVSSIMTAHLAVPAIEPDSTLPATLSKNVLSGLLREQLGFKGLIATDALEMGGVTRLYWPGEVAVRAIEAGADCLLLPPDPELAFRYLMGAVRSGRITEQRLNQSVERILRAKARVGLHRQRLVSLDNVAKVVADPQAQTRIEQIANASITLVRDQANAIPMSLAGRKKLLVVVMTADPNPADDVFVAELRRRAESADVMRLAPDFTEARAQEVLKRAAGARAVIVALFVRAVSSKGTVGMPANQAALLKQLAASGKPVVAVSFGNPYLIRAFPEVGTYLCAYSTADASERAAVRAIFGEVPISGRLPVTIPGIAPLGTGPERPAIDTKLRDETAGQDARLEKVFQIVEKGIAEKAFPGAVLAVGQKGSLVALKVFGKFDYSKEAPPVTVDTIYDLASVSKVVGTTTAAAILYEKGELLLDLPAVRYIPEFGGAPGHDQVTVRHLLRHCSGLAPDGKLFAQVANGEELLKRIYEMPLAAKPGEKYVYSDLGFIVLGKIIERITGQPLNIFLQERVYAPLGMKDTLYNPPKSLLPRIPPTEQDGVLRKRVVRGEVHDENAWVLGGVAGHAGLFSTAPDLAVFAQMMLDGGSYSGRRILKRSTIETFTTHEPEPPSTHALGWEMKSACALSSECRWAGASITPRWYGHTGFTGTTIWIEPEQQLFVILLTNRVHPTRANNKIGDVRAALHDAVVESLK
jgi:beta-glucosidase-like glycosyl hydrolase/CubicO group peptidase (beta-lactamase class C family)